MASRRYPTKLAWAQAQVETLRQDMHALRYEPTRFRAHDSFRKQRQLRNLDRELRKFERLVERFSASGE